VTPFRTRGSHHVKPRVDHVSALRFRRKIDLCPNLVVVAHCIAISRLFTRVCIGLESQYVVVVTTNERIPRQQQH
jgi:hypothetical protein